MQARGLRAPDGVRNVVPQRKTGPLLIFLTPDVWAFHTKQFSDFPQTPTGCPYKLTHF